MNSPQALLSPALILAFWMPNALGEPKQIWAKSILGKPAPELAVEKWLTPEPDTDGKFVLVDFWATWCDACHEAIPLMNAIQDRFEGKLVVIGLSNEPEQTVMNFKTPKPNYSLAIDSRNQTAQSLNVTGIPHALLIDPDGIVRWEGYPMLEEHQLTPEIVAGVMNQFGQPAAPGNQAAVPPTPAPPSPSSPSTPSPVRAEVVSKRIPVGEQTSLILNINNSKPDSLPKTISVDGLQIQLSNHHGINTGVDGRGAYAEYQYYYMITADKAGEFVIPALTIPVQGKQYQTEPIELTVYERDPSDPALDASRPYFANLVAPSREIYAGQMIPLELGIYVRGTNSINDIGPANLRHESVVIDFDRSYRPDGVRLDGIVFTTMKVPGSIFGLTPGSYTVGPAEVLVSIMDDSSNFGRMQGFFGRFVERTLRSNPLDITVKPLPSEGRPDTFLGSVGKFEITAKATPLTLTVGDPISIDFEVTGPGNYRTLQAPSMVAEKPSDWRSYEARKIIDPTEFSDGVKEGRATFNKVVMPQAEVTQLPPFELAFFNPETGAYETRRTEPIAIRVAPDPRLQSGGTGIALTAGNSENSNTDPYAMESTPTPEATFNDIVHIRTTEPHWQPTPAIITRRPLFWIGQIVPSLALLGLLGFAAARHLGQQRATRGKSHTTSFRARVAAAENAPNRERFYKSVLAALESWQIEAGPKKEAALPENLRQSIDALRSRSHGLLYGTSDENRAAPPDPAEKNEAGQILAVLAQQLK